MDQGIVLVSVQQHRIISYVHSLANHYIFYLFNFNFSLTLILYKWNICAQSIEMIFISLIHFYQFFLLSSPSFKGLFSLWQWCVWGGGWFQLVFLQGFNAQLGTSVISFSQIFALYYTCQPSFSNLLSAGKDLDFSRRFFCIN